MNNKIQRNLNPYYKQLDDDANSEFGYSKRDKNVNPIYQDQTEDPDKPEDDDLQDFRN